LVWQWNANGVKNKKEDLEKEIHEHSPDVIMIQETLLKTADVFEIPGYACVRAGGQRGRQVGVAAVSAGGVATLIKNGLVYREEKTKYTAAGDAETDCVAIELLGKSKILLVNIYVPPIRAGAGDARTQRFSPAPWPRGFRSFICGDVNAHSATWDPHVQEDALGEAIGDWALENDYVPMNDGTATRQALSVPYTRSAPESRRQPPALTVDWQDGVAGEKSVPTII
jgi:exonuclease III